ncbi:hypothetical protein Tco_0690320 [Tanacetum coccineum]
MGNSKDSNSICSILKKIGFDTSIDHIWKERNNRIFTQERKSYNQVLQSIIENIRPQLMSLSIKKSTNNLKVAEVWEVLPLRRENGLEGRALPEDVATVLVLVVNVKEM